MAIGVWFAASAVAVLTGCEPAQPPLVIYVSADESIARPILAEFTRQTGHPVHMVGDVEATKTTGLVQRLRSEADHPQADVFWSSEAILTIALAHEGLLRPHTSDVATSWPVADRDPAFCWFGFSARPRVVVFDPERLAGADRPRSLADLTQPRFLDQLVMADPRFGTTGGHLAALKAWFNQQGTPEAYAAWLAGLQANRIRVLPGGNAAVVEAIRNGEALAGLTDADDVRAINRLGASLEMVPLGPTQDTGTFLMPNTVARVAGRDHPEVGALVDYLLSDGVARTLAESTSGNIPTRESVAAEYPHLQVGSPLSVDLETAAGVRSAAVREAILILNAAANEDGHDQP
jgi:iron(III) transport system substrate-binding protein